MSDRFATRGQSLSAMLWTMLIALSASGSAITDGSEDHAQPTAMTQAIVALTPGWATFGQALPQGVAFEALQVGALKTQTDVKTRWPDGSIRFAVVTAKVETAGSYPIRAASVSKERSKWTTLPIEVRFAAVGSQPEKAMASLPAAAKPESLWLDGPLVMEARWSVVPSDSRGVKLSGVRVLFDERKYADGARRLAVTIENADDSPENRPQQLGIQIVRVSQPGDSPSELIWKRDNLAMSSGTRFVRRFRWDLNESTVTPDFEPAFRSGALPRFAADISNRIDSARGESGKLRRTFDLLGPGDLNPYMGSPGGRPDVAPYTDWTARYLVHRRPEQLEYLLRTADLAGSWPIHLREPSDGRLVSLSERPKFWFDSRGEDHVRSANWGGSPLSPDNAHVPGGLAFVPYLVTGDRHYADEMASWANFAVLSTWPGNTSADDASRAGGDANAGPGRGILGTNQVRGFAWSLRNIADAAAFLPDNDPLRPQFQRVVQENLAWLDHWAETHTGPLGMAWLPGYGTEVDGTQRFAQLWMYDYLAWAIHRAQQLGFTGGSKFRDQIVRLQTELFVNRDFDREYAAPGRLPIGVLSKSDGSTKYFSTLQEVLAATRRGHPAGNFAGYYGTEARLMLLIGLETGVTGTDPGRVREALDFLNDRKRHPGMFDDPLTRSGFGIAGPDHPAK
ncbi:MAG: PDK repeat-containing protein [Planctomycetota bacterium]|nr:MAG: PDK repeat-containing protein [Planctomycetota bacterium]